MAIRAKPVRKLLEQAHKFKKKPAIKALRKLPKDCYVKFKLLQLKRRTLPDLNGSNGDLIVSLTSFPERIEFATDTIESIFHQTCPPDKIVLALSKQEFQDIPLPSRLNKMEQHGLEILWVDDNPMSYKKLIPARTKYPDASIVTVDDDVFYRNNFLYLIQKASQAYPNHVIGYRGWTIQPNTQYLDWKRAKAGQSAMTMLIGCGGIRYPPGFPSSPTILDIETARAHCPTADDIWFWAAARLEDKPIYCLGINKVFEIPGARKTSSLKDKNRGRKQNDEQFQSVVNFLGPSM